MFNSLYSKLLSESYDEALCVVPSSICIKHLFYAFEKVCVFYMHSDIAVAEQLSLLLLINVYTLCLGGAELMLVPQYILLFKL